MAQDLHCTQGSSTVHYTVMCHVLYRYNIPTPPLDKIRVMVIVWRLRGNIIRTALCWIVWHNVHSQQHTYMSSSYRSNRLGLSHCNLIVTDINVIDPVWLGMVNDQRDSDEPVVTVDVGHVHLMTCDKRVAIEQNVAVRWMWNQVTGQQKAQDAAVEWWQWMHHTLYYLQLIQRIQNNTVSRKNDTNVAAHYNFNAHQPILVTFGRDLAERVCYQKVICYPTSPN